MILLDAFCRLEGSPASHIAIEAHFANPGPDAACLPPLLTEE